MFLLSLTNEDMEEDLTSWDIIECWTCGKSYSISDESITWVWGDPVCPHCGTMVQN